MDNAPKCGHSLATCHGDVCLVAKPKEVPPEILAEEALRTAQEHAKSLYHMGVQQLDVELDRALERAEDIYQHTLSKIRHTRHQEAEECTCATTQ